MPGIQRVPASERLASDLLPEGTLAQKRSTTAEDVPRFPEPSCPHVAQLADVDEAGQLPQDEPDERAPAPSLRDDVDDRHRVAPDVCIPVRRARHEPPAER